MTKSDEKSPKKSEKSRGLWIDDLYRAAGRMVRLETTDGVHRSGRMSGLRSREIQYNGTLTEFVVEIELNGDPSDTVPLGSLVRLDID